MIDLACIVGFNWDPGNARKSLEKHGVSQLEAEQVFLDPQLTVLSDLAHSETDQRYQALGRTLGGRYLHVTLTLHAEGTEIRVISARDMNRKERVLYEKET